MQRTNTCAFGGEDLLEDLLHRNRRLNREQETRDPTGRQTEQHRRRGRRRPMTAVVSPAQRARGRPERRECEARRWRDSEGNQ